MVSTALLAAETDFALGLLQQTPVEANVFSPLSIAIALSVLYSGAGGKTKTEIGDVILKGELFFLLSPSRGPIQ